MSAQAGVINNSTITAGAVANGVGNRIRIGNTNHYYGGGGGRGDGEPPPTPALVMFGLGMVVVVATVAWWFAKHAALFYPLATSLGAGEALLALLFLGLNLYEQSDVAVAFRDLVGLVIAAAVASALYFSAVAYPVELTEIAGRSTSAMGFWCGLNTYGHQVAMHQLVTALLGTLGVLMLVPHTLAGIADFIWESGAIKDLLRRTAAPGWLLVGALVAAGAWVLIGMGPESLGNLDIPMLCPQ